MTAQTRFFQYFHHGILRAAGKSHFSWYFHWTNPKLLASIGTTLVTYEPLGLIHIKNKSLSIEFLNSKNKKY
jgi:hypothetical protein